MRSYLFVLALAIVAGAVLLLSNAQTARLNSTADCVTKTAKAQGYAGNPYGPEAWALFASKCN